MNRDHVVWVLRALWFAAPFTVGNVLSDAVGDAENPFRFIVSIALWVIWALALAALFVPIPRTLTAIRVLIPAAVPAALWAAVQTDDATWAVVGVAASLVATIVALNPLVGDRFVDGASYGDERRMLLRPPGAVLLGPLPLAWLVAVAGAATGPLLLASGSWIAGAAASVIGVPLAALAVRSLDSLTQRWLVFVPTGVVLHDLTTVQDPVLFGRDRVHFVGPALADTEATDLSAGSRGLLVEVNFVEPMKVPVRSSTGPGAIQSGPQELAALLVAPTLPGAALSEADRRQLPVH